jgi:PAB-dependent poly(A)-specific ribonuclease subunit 3
VYDYIPLATTLEKSACATSSSREKTRNVISRQPNEHQIWTVLIQVLTAIRQIHATGLACQTIVPSKVLVPEIPSTDASRHRVRLNGLGALEFILAEQTKEKAKLHIVGYVDKSAQMQDLVQLGHIIMHLADPAKLYRGSTTITQVQDLMKNFSTSLSHLVCYLLSPGPSKTADHVLSMCTHQIPKELEALRRYYLKLFQ